MRGLLVDYGGVLTTSVFASFADFCAGLVSNSWGLDWYDHDLLGELFDGVVLSGAVGIRKPAPEIYRMGAESVGLPPGECAFVDDLGGNLKPAQALGMATVRHETTDRTVTALEHLFGVDLS